MRPVSLQLKGFTAFRDEQRLDFSDLDLFALCGPMGSGKSSLLDAITYALYGKVERVGKDAKQLISQGQPSMSVSFEFDAGDQRFRVARRTQRAGGATARLDVLNGEWRSYGEGADSIRGVNRMIVEVVGLDYLAFTRSVLLPQGKFAEFLVGEARDRREILTELLGLELFERMSRRANEIATEARSKADNTELTLARHFANVTEEALKEARRAATDAKKLATETESLQANISELLRRAEAIERSVAAIEDCTGALEETAEGFRGHERTLNGHIRSLKSAEDDVASARLVVEKAKDALDGAEADLAKALQQWGTPQQLAGLNEKIEQLNAARREAATAATALEESIRARAAFDDGAGRLEAALETAQAELQSRSKALEDARKMLQESHHRDLVGALVSGLEAGAPCPVCERPLESIPTVSSTAHEKAAAAAQRAEKDKESADRAIGKAETDVAVAKQTLEAASQEEQRCRREAKRWAQAATDLEKTVAEGFGDDLPEDPRAVIAARLSELEDLAAERDSALGEVKLAEEALQDRVGAVDHAHREVERVRTAMEHSGIDRLIRQALAAVPRLKGGDAVPSRFPEEPEELARTATVAADALANVVSDLREESARRQRECADLTAQGRSLVPDSLRAEGANLDDMLVTVTGACRTAAEAAVRLETTAEKLAESVATKKSLEAEVEVARAEHSLYRSLHLDLRSDRIVDYLQAEALAALAAAGSERLFELSGNRYRLAYENDEFFVVDAWNGDERRSVHTLSGGETFLASLALALALSEQVQLLAVTERSRLESLFLDEGFGSLDAESLDVVVAAIEQLGGDDRMVGIITHVPEVADRLPVRIQVEKSPRGSRLVRSVQPGH